MIPLMKVARRHKSEINYATIQILSIYFSTNKQASEIS